MGPLPMRRKPDPRIRQWLPLAHKLARRYAAVYGDPEHGAWYSIALEGIWRATQTYAPERGFAFSTHVHNSISWALRRELSKRYREARAFGSVARIDTVRSTTSVDADRPLPLAADTPLPSANIDSDQLARALARLPERLQQVIALLFFQDTAKPHVALNVHRSRVAQLRQQALALLRAMLREDGGLNTIATPRVRAYQPRRKARAANRSAGVA